MRRALALLFLVALLASAASGQGSASRQDRFRLFNACRPMQLLVESLGNEERKIGLTEDALQAAAESRLRAARLYTEDPEGADDATLYVNVNVAGRAFNISVEYTKALSDAFGETGLARTWISGSTGTASTGGFIVSSLSQYLDRFLAAYLRINEEACSSQP